MRKEQKKKELAASALDTFSGSENDVEVDEELSFLPEKIRERLLPFQKEGIQFALKRNGRCMIADEMGLGKTIQAIAVAYFYKSEWPLLIVVPSSLKYPWIEELEKWIPELCPHDISVIENKIDIGRIATAKVTVLGYGLLTTDAETLIDSLYKQSFKVILVDESHYIKSRTSSRSTILVPIVQKATRAILLTGTPALGRPEELFMQVEALYPRRFGTWTEYAKQYCNAHIRHFGRRTQWDYKGASNLNELHQRLNTIMIRRLKQDVLTQLPPKIRQRIPFDLPKDVAKEMNASFEEYEKLMRSPDSFASDTSNPFVQVMGHITRMYKQTAIAKAGAVKDYVKMMLENDKLKFLVFGHHLTMLQACTEAAIESKARYIRIDGSVPSIERIHLVHQFQNDPDTRVAILSIQAAGQGLTLTAATHVVFAELYWDPGHIKQAEDRAHRIGQNNNVHIHYLIAKGTLDTLMWGMLNRKANVTSNALNGMKEKIQAEEDDKEKWDFLSFSKSWIPNDSLETIKDDILFSHFEKEKQHDIRSFFTPKRDADKKRKMISCEASVTFSSESFEKDEHLKSSKIVQDCVHQEEPLNRSEIIDVDAIFCEETNTPEAKRFRSVGHMPKMDDMPKRKSWGGQDSSSLTEKRVRVLSEGLQTSATNKNKVMETTWNCAICTYSNASLLPYCEICENPRTSTVPLEIKQKDSADRLLIESQNDILVGRRSKYNVILKSNSPKPPVEQSLPSLSSESTETGAHLVNDPKDNGKEAEEGVENLDPSRIFDGLMFCASKNTDRIYLYTKDGEQLNCNFIPLDIKLDIWDDLPEIFRHPLNRSLVLRFVREWNSLTAMKQRILRKSGEMFCSPILALLDITKRQDKRSSTKRYLTKGDVAVASINKAQSDGGSLRLISKEAILSLKHETDLSNGKEKNESIEVFLKAEKDPSAPSSLQPTEESSKLKGYVQALDKEGNPLCLQCQQPTPLPSKDNQSTAWDTRFCSQICQEDFFIRSSQGYMRAKVFETEHGVCQTCHLNAQELYLTVRDAPVIQRKSLLESTWMSQLSLAQLNEIIRNPTEGLFWQVDHINPVYGGGGQCSIENLQTLCTVCHKERTAVQAKERSQTKRLSAASKYASDITKFLVKS
ncbi:DNA annealing helicase and endonuclease ZRANB3 isoform X2 [Ambystoma mexicanum]|uniref:DNA annealing helicase and endonuclease ZRANB3 isoform X2 n=1 Tax=Ambystoma mexicanum TaxID=8296 RepID=UPI0037E7310B